MALEVFSYRVKKYIGAYSAALSGLDAVTFTGGIESNSPEVRARSLDDLDFLGVEIDEERNARCVGSDAEISSERSKVKVFSILTNEELVIALDTERIVSSSVEYRR